MEPKSEYIKETRSRGYRRDCIRGWTEENQRLYAEFEESRQGKIADNLLQMDNWIAAVEHLVCLSPSRKAWGLLRKRGGCNRYNVSKTAKHPNEIAENSRCFF